MKYSVRKARKLNRKADHGLIFLIGFSGSGKSTIGPRLAQRLGKEFIDTDTAIEQQEGQSINQLFSRYGEKYFRECERQMIEAICDSFADGGVAALGGGAFESIANRRKTLKSGTVVYLSCSQRRLYERLRYKSNRPMLISAVTAKQAPATDLKLQIRKLLGKRLGNYRKAHMTVSTADRTVAETVRIICTKLQDRYEHR